MDLGGDGGGGLTATGLSCASCGTHLPLDSLFCNKCGAPIYQAKRSAEFKQVTVLFADVVHSMDIAKAVGAERLREIMAGLLDRATAVVGRYGGTVDKFTGDGIMAVFGAPVALEDHALRACRAALDIHSAISDLTEEVSSRDGLDLRVRVGLNSGQVIAGEIGSGAAGYTAIGEQVGMAQRMESVAPPGGVMLSASTARLVEAVASLGDPELVQIKGAEQPVVARRLIEVSDPDRAGAAPVSALVGRRWEIAAVEGLLQRAIEGHGAVVTVVGSPGIGKSRLVREVSTLAATQGVDVFTAYCESHTTQVPFHAVARLLRAATGVEHLDPEQARMRLRGLDSDADPEDVLLFEDLVSIRDLEVELPKIDPDARRRRLTALVNTATLAREAPAVYVIEDAHWIDEVSESMLADFFTVIPQTASLVLVTYRSEYRGVLSQVPGAQTIALSPLSDPETATLVGELVGKDPSVRSLATLVVERAAGNPFFAHEIVRDLAERGVLHGHAADYVSTLDMAEVSLPATVQATIAARIDRLDPAAKRTLSAAAVIGSKFNWDLLETLGVDPLLDELVRGQFLDQISFARHPEYVFHHPLVRTVAYESQLKSDRADLHRRIATTIEADKPGAADENAALIAEHLEAAGDLYAAYGWHMRAASWATNREIAAARLSWERAERIADALPSDDPHRPTLRIAPRTMLCGTAFRVHEHLADTRFEELRQLCTAAGDKASLAIGAVGLTMDHAFSGRVREASQLASETMNLAEAVGDPTLTVALSTAPFYAKLENTEYREALQWSQQVIDLTAGDPSKGNFLIGSPLALAMTTRGVASYCLGRPGWREDLQRGLDISRGMDPLSYATVVAWVFNMGIPLGVFRPDDRAMREIAEALHFAERSGDDLALAIARLTLGQALMGRPTAAERDRGQQVLTEFSEEHSEHFLADLPMVTVYLERERALRCDPDEAIPRMRAAVNHLFREERLLGWGINSTGVLVETLLNRGTKEDVAEAEAAIQRLATAPTDDEVVLVDIWLLRLRGLLARAQSDDLAYRDYRDRYRKMATDLGFEGHIDWAEAMP
ncbi:MAG: ATP-binding protein [Candidatus Nanopelagicales bacterium]